MARVVDIALMSGFDPTALNAGVAEGTKGGQVTADGRVVNAGRRKADPLAEERTRSVSRGVAFFGRRTGQGGLDTVSCAEHGAMLCVAKTEAGRLWRCPTCNEGAFQPAEVPA